MTPDIGTFTLKRGEHSYGPYTAAEVAAYLAAGNIVSNDAIFDHHDQVWTTAGALITRLDPTAPAMDSSMPSTASAPAPPATGIPPSPPRAPDAPPTIPGHLTAASTGGAPASGNNGVAIVALVLGALAMFSCGPFTGIPAMVQGARTYSNPSDATMARIGMILGIVGTALSVLAGCGALAMYILD